MPKAPSIQQLAAESWIWYGVCILIVSCRYLSQWILRGSWRKLQADDWLMVFVTCTYTITIVCTNTMVQLCAEYGASTSAEHKVKTFWRIGVLNLLLETAMLTTLWGAKACFLICYHRITSLQAHNLVVKGAAIYCAIGYVVIIVCLYGGFCRPFSNYFIAEPDNIQCLTWFKYNIVELCFNASSDILILCIPTTLVATSHMKWQKKTLLCLVFSLGIFVVISAALTKYFAFSSPLTYIFVLWYVREASTAMLVANLFLCLPLCKMLWGVGVGGLVSMPGSNRSSGVGILDVERERERASEGEGEGEVESQVGSDTNRDLDLEMGRKEKDEG